MAGHPHLPPGIPPGAQSRSLRANLRLMGCMAPFVVVCGLLFLLVVAGVLLFSGAVSDAPLPPGLGAPSPLVLTAAAVGGLLAFGIPTAVIWRRFHPQHAEGLAVAVERQRLRRGEAVHATVTAGGSGAELGLVCRVHYDVKLRSGIERDTRRRVTSIAVAWQVWQPAGPSGADLRVPEEAPPSYEGDAVSFAWAVQARAVGTDRPSAPVPVWVEP